MAKAKAAEEDEQRSRAALDGFAAEVKKVEDQTAAEARAVAKTRSISKVATRDLNDEEWVANMPSHHLAGYEKFPHHSSLISLEDIQNFPQVSADAQSLAELEQSEIQADKEGTQSLMQMQDFDDQANDDIDEDFEGEDDDDAALNNEDDEDMDDEAEEPVQEPKKQVTA